MRLMTYLGLTLVFSLPAMAIYIDGGIDCYPSEVNGQAETILEFWWDVWDGWWHASATIQITGPSGGAADIDSAWYPEYWAEATASITSPAVGTYQYVAWHQAYFSWWETWVGLAYATTSCEVHGGGGGGGNDPTPVISGMTTNGSATNIWYAGSGPQVHIIGSGFGSNWPLNVSDHLSVSAGVSPAVTSWSDTGIWAYMSVPSNATTQIANVSVTSTGYYGMGFQQQPGGGGPISNTVTAQVQAYGCGDERDSLIYQYLNYGVNFVPNCGSFTNSAASEFFSFSELTVNSGASSWAIIRPPLTVAKSSGYGLDRWRQLIGTPQHANSVYRTPAHNWAIGGASQSRHMYGDAVDLANQTNTSAEYWAKRANAIEAEADYVEEIDGPCMLSCVHADWRFH
jgi:hypothetical protein